MLSDRRVQPWIFSGPDWLIRDSDGPYVGLEERTVEFGPTVVRDFGPTLSDVAKIVGVSTDFELLARCEDDVRAALAGQVSVARSQPYYLDITHKNATKEVFVEYLARSLSISRDEIATIGDMPSDLSMFTSCGLSIAMGNAPDHVKAAATRVTLANSENGFAYAMREFVLKPILQGQVNKKKVA